MTDSIYYSMKYATWRFFKKAPAKKKKFRIRKTNANNTQKETR